MHCAHHRAANSRCRWPRSAATNTGGYRVRPFVLVQVHASSSESPVIRFLRVVFRAFAPKLVSQFSRVVCEPVAPLALRTGTVNSVVANTIDGGDILDSQSSA